MPDKSKREEEEERPRSECYGNQSNTCHTVEVFGPQPEGIAGMQSSVSRMASYKSIYWLGGSFALSLNEIFKEGDVGAHRKRESVRLS